MADDPAEARRRCRRQQRDFLIICGGILLAACLLPPPSEDALSLFGLRLPALCPSRSLFGLTCPGCGITRSFVCMGHGLWSEAYAYHRVGPLAFTYIALQIPYRLWCYRRAQVWESRWLVLVPLSIFALMIINWIANAASGALLSQ